MDDRTISTLLINDSQQGLEIFIRQYRGLAGAVISRVLAGHQQDIDECISDTFISVWNYRKKLHVSGATLKGLVCCIARNKAINRYRKLSRHTQVYIEDKDLISDIDIAIQLEKKYDIETVQLLICEMSEPDREVFIRRYILMQPVREISVVLHMDERQVSNRLYQSRLRLKTKLRQKGVTL